MSKVTELPDKRDEWGSRPATPPEMAAGVVQAHLALLRAIQKGVFVLADDIGDAQRREIARELNGMLGVAELTHEKMGLPDTPGTMHFQRETYEESGASR